MTPEQIMNAIEKRYSDFESKLKNEYKATLKADENLQNEVESELQATLNRVSAKMGKQTLESIVADFNNEMDAFEKKWHNRLS